jgi:enoyl-CoA hydratase
VDTIRLEHRDGVAVVSLHRPRRMNAVVEAMYHELGQALSACAEDPEVSACAEDPEVRCLVLTGSSFERDGLVKHAFCAGADLKEHATGTRNREQRRAYIELAHATCRRLSELPKPAIAAVNGPARGAGTELALCCDLILVAEEATLALPEAGLGTFVGGGATSHLPRLVGLARARELVYTGRVVDGREAVALGLALSCHPVDRLLDEANALAARVARQAPLSLAFAKDLLQRSPGLDLGTVLDLEAKAILSCMETDDWKEGLRAFAERRAPEFRGR